MDRVSGERARALVNMLIGLLSEMKKSQQGDGTFQYRAGSRLIWRSANGIVLAVRGAQLNALEYVYSPLGNVIARDITGTHNAYD